MTNLGIVLKWGDLCDNLELHERQQIFNLGEQWSICINYLAPLFKKLIQQIISFFKTLKITFLLCGLVYNWFGTLITSEKPMHISG